MSHILNPDLPAASGSRDPRAPSPVPDAMPQALPLQFRGAARDYFGVWVVNVLLTLCTLGVWSAWAKVRTRRWFHGHTYLAGAGFDYHATGGQLFKGRLLAIMVIAGVSIFGAIWPLAEHLLSLFMLLGMPWAINAGLRFNACMTSWRNVRFDFHGRYGRAFVVFILLPMASFLTLGLLAPLTTRHIARHMVGGHRFGAAAFTCDPRLGILYAALLRGVGLFIVISLLGTLAADLTGRAMNPDFSLAEMLRGIAGPIPNGNQAPSPGLRMFLTVLPVLLLTFCAALVVAAMYYRACAHNEILNQCTLQGGNRLQSTLAPIRYIWIVLSGIVVSILTLSLAYPWARVRRYRYLTQRIIVLAAPGVDAFVSQQPARAPGAFGAEFSQFEGFAGVSSL